MTDERKTAKPRSKKKMPDEEASAKFAVVNAALARIPFDGFTDKVLQDSASDAGVDRQLLLRLFPDGPRSLVEAYSEMADRDMAARIANATADTRVHVPSSVEFGIRFAEQKRFQGTELCLG